MMNDFLSEDNGDKNTFLFDRFRSIITNLRIVLILIFRHRKTVFLNGNIKASCVMSKLIERHLSLCTMPY